MKRYGIKLSAIESIPVTGLRRHPLNIIRQNVDPESDRVLSADLRKQGQNEPIIVTPSNEVVVGWRRVERFRRLKLETIEARYTEPNPPKEQLIQLIYRDNTLREGYSDTDYEAILLTIFTPTQLSSNEERYLHRKAEELTGVPAGTWGRVIASWRKANQKTGRIQWDLKDEEKKYARRMLKELEQIQEREKKALQTVQEIKEKRRQVESEILGLLPRASGIKGKENRLEAVRRKAQ